MKVEAFVLRLDMIHPFISGNKWFKLKYFINSALDAGKPGLVSFGGAYSNHLVAMAHACKEHGLKSFAFVRGEEHDDNSSVQEMRAAGMKLKFVSRDAYRNKEELINEYGNEFTGFYYVPEGGRSEEGVRGASEILNLVPGEYTHIMCAAGTGTTLAGIARSSLPEQSIIGIPVLKFRNEQNNDLADIIEEHARNTNCLLKYNYHFGGYAASSQQLLEFMNNFYQMENVPSDFVYTGKMFFAAEDLIEKGFFPVGSTILLIHTGGLQGNHSLPAGTLLF